MPTTYKPMNQPEQHGAYLIRLHGPTTALEIAAKKLDEAYEWSDDVNGCYALAVYCYIKGYSDAPTHRYPAAALQAAIGGVKCSRMARAWRNRSNETQGNWARLCRDIFNDTTLTELHRRAACVYAACSWYTCRVGSDTFDGATIPAKGWELIVSLVEDFLTTPPDRALDRGAWEILRQEEAKIRKQERKHA